MAGKKRCFVVAPIGDRGSNTRKRSDQVINFVLTPVLEEVGYDAPERADNLPSPGMITTQVIDCVMDADLVIADLTERNPNVFYELAIRHAVRKPFIQLIDDSETIPFDVSDMRTVRFNIHDLDSVEDAKASLRTQIEAIHGGGLAIETPISTAVDLKALRGSENPEDRSLAEVLEALGGVTRALKQVEHRIAAVESGANNVWPYSKSGGLPDIFGRQATRRSIGDAIRFGFTGEAGEDEAPESPLPAGVPPSA